MSIKADVIQKIDQRVINLGETTSEAAEAVLGEMTSDDRLGLFDECGRSLLIFLYDSHLTQLRRKFRASGVDHAAPSAEPAAINKPAAHRNGGTPANMNADRSPISIRSVFDYRYLGADGVFKRLGDFTLADVEYQITHYENVIQSHTVEQGRFLALRDELQQQESPTVGHLYHGREGELEELFRSVK